MTRRPSTVARTTRLGLYASLLFPAVPGVVAQVPFQRVEIEQIAGDVKLVADIDLDGTLDVVLGGSLSEGLNWFHYPTWVRTRIAIPVTEFTTDGSIGDIDGDGDPDIVVPDGSSGANLLWFENPTRRPDGTSGNPFAAAQWQRREIGAIGSWGKDVYVADYDADGRCDVAVRKRDGVMIFFHEPNGTWTTVPIPCVALGSEGMALGDVDRDGAPDLVVHGAWLRNPAGVRARTSTAWTEHGIDTGGYVDANFKALVADVDGDGRNDVLFSCSERTADVVWFGHGGNPTGTWTVHVVAPQMQRAHTLQVADMDRDGDADIVVGQMHTASQPDIHVYYNTDGRGLTWSAQLVDNSQGIHNGVVADIGADGDFEIVGSNWTGNPPLQFWENLTPAPRLVLDVPGLVSGRTNDYRVSNIAPGEPVMVCFSLTGVTTPYTVPSAHTTFALLAPQRLAVAAAGVNGVAHFSLTLPPGLAGIPVWLQAIQDGHSSQPRALALQ